jgi:branched-chain amino acid transport system substrate-binding protein
MKRRQFLKVAAGGIGATLSAPAFLSKASAQTAVKFGIPTALSGAQSIFGEQTKRGVDYFAKEINAKGGILGRPVEIIYEDTAADPATAVRKAQKLVEKDGVRFLAGVAMSSEALAISPKGAEWNSLLISTITGAGALTTTAFNRNFFRVNKTAAMGARVSSLYLKEAPMKKFYGLGSDYAYGRDAIASFVKQLAGTDKQVVGTDFPPLGTKDFASYIAKIKDSGADACYFAVPGQDGTIFFKQAHQFGMTRNVKMIVESFDLKYVESIGDPIEGAIGPARYAFTIDTPRNKKFVEGFHAMYKAYPDYPDATAYQALDWLSQIIQKVGTADDLEKIITAWEDSNYDGLEGPLFMRKCDHQVAQGGLMVVAARDPKYPGLVPTILTRYSAEQVTPKCRSEIFD